jgi:hypothetical protein
MITATGRWYSCAGSKSCLGPLPPPPAAMIGAATAAEAAGPQPAPPIDAPCPQRLRHGEPMHAQERLTADAAAARVP